MGRDAVRRTAASGDIVVIAKDQHSAKLLGTTSEWKRRYDAQIVDKLRVMGAKTILFNEIMAEPSNPLDDAALAAAFERAGGKVWLSAQLAENSSYAKWDASLPMPLFRAKTRQAHYYLWHGIFGNAEYFPRSRKIGQSLYPSEVEVLAGVDSKEGSVRPDFTIDYKSIPTISAADFLLGVTNDLAISGKTVVIADFEYRWSKSVTILGQGGAPAVYSFVIAAETLKAGAARQLGYLIPLLICALIGLACVLRSARRERNAILIAGAIGLIVLMFIGDRLKLHFEMVPALLALSIFGVRDVLRGNVIAAMTTNAVSGLPNLAHLPFVKGAEKSVVVAVKVERFASLVSDMSLADHKGLVESIAARINIIAPDCLVHDGDDGLFVILITPDSVVEVDLVVEQLHALFTEKVVSLDSILKIYVSIGMNDDANLRFGERVAVAIDRALHSAFVTLRQVV
jgi:diguanylate cyclase